MITGLELLGATLILLGLYTTYLLNTLKNLSNQIEMANEVIIGMAQELQRLGSPNVKVITNEE